ncbi:TetR/AcrR family transcriptional regulator [Streptomyces sp. NPDC096311]|uniref:TetR/AcrR family transcriptional regulator n=1 Tax=Streptomyces sp. NPDC096311 TaxID=3366083 RepID=UPI0037F1270B
MGEVRRRGRPRSATADQAILEATRELLVENGYARLSMEGVAARTGVGKPTVYRRWRSKGALVADAVRDGLLSTTPGRDLAPPNTGNAEQDLRAWLHRYTLVATDPRNVPLALALTAAAAENPHDAEVLYQQLTGPQHAALVERLRSAADSGQLRADADVEAVADAVIGAVLFQLLTGNAAASPQRADALFDILLAGLRPAPSRN